MTTSRTATRNMTLEQIASTKGRTGLELIPETRRMMEGMSKGQKATVTADLDVGSGSEQTTARMNRKIRDATEMNEVITWMEATAELLYGGRGYRWTGITVERR